jgi:hypothetical protein
MELGMRANFLIVVRELAIAANNQRRYLHDRKSKGVQVKYLYYSNLLSCKDMQRQDGRLETRMELNVPIFYS